MVKEPVTSKGKYFEFRDGKSQMFWEIILEGSSHTVRFGRIGTQGQTRTKSFASDADARASCDKLIKQKTKKGYKPLSAAAGNGRTSPAKATKKRNVTSRTAATGDACRSDIGPAGPAPQLYVVDPDVHTDKRWTAEVLTMNCLDMDPDDWWKAFHRLQRASETSGKPLPMIVERHGQGHDCSHTDLFEFRGDTVRGFQFWTAVSLLAWQKLCRLLDGRLNTIPVITTREARPGEFGFPKLAAGQRSRYLLLSPKLKIPFRHGQDMTWNEKKSTFEPFMQDKSLPKIPMIDPAEIADNHLFMLVHWLVATETFVRAVERAKITGLKFLPLEYLPSPRERPPAPRRLLEPMRSYPAALLAKGWSEQLGREWEAMWDWTTRGLQNRSWPAKGVRKTPPVEKSTLDSFGLPPRFRAVLQSFAASVEIDRGFVVRTDPRASHHQDIREHVGSFLFQGKQKLWDFGALQDMDSWRSWQAEAHGIAQCKVRTAPFLIVANGDVVTVNLDTEEIRYWSHDGDESLNRRLGVDLLDFVTRWSWLGVPSIDFLPDTPFYDKRRRCLHTNEVPRIRRWRRWLQGHDFSSTH